MNRTYFGLKSMALFATALLLSFITSCEKDTEPTNFAPTVVTGSAENIYRFGATLSGSIENPNGYYIKEGGIEYSEYETFSVSEKVKTTLTDAQNLFSIALSNLESDKKYYYRTYAFSGYNTVYSKTENFTTSKTSGPIFGATTTSNATFTTFDVSAELMDDGGDSNPSLKGFIYKQVEENDHTEFNIGQTGVQYIATESAGYSATIKNLYSNTRYAVRPIGISSLGLGLGEIAYVYTQKTDNALISSCTLSDTIQNTIRVSANLLSQGTYDIEEYGFCYSTEVQEPTAISNLKNIASVNGSTFSTTLTNLPAETTYWIRAYVKDNAGNYTYSETATYTVIKHTVTSGPIFGTTTTSNATFTSFDVTAELLSDGGDSNPTLKGFIYKQVEENDQAEFTIGQPGVDFIASTGEGYSATINNLYTNTRYAVRPIGISSYGMGMGTIAYVYTLKTDNALISSCTLSDTIQNSIRVTANLLSQGTYPIVEYGFCYSTEVQEPTAESNLKNIATVNGSSFSTTLNNLTSETTYWVRAYVKDNAGNYTYSETASYTVIQHTMLVVSTLPADEITITKAQLHGHVEASNVNIIKEQGFCWSYTKALPETTDSKLTVQTTTGNYAATISVNHGTTYYYRAYAINMDGSTFYGDVMSFTTPDLTPLVLTVGDATNVTETSATVSGTISNKDNISITMQGFCWSAENAEPVVGDATTATLTTQGTAFENMLNNLTPGTKYYYRIFAINEIGINYSEVKQFTTAISYAPTLSETTVSEVTLTTARTSASILNDGGAAISERGFCISSVSQSPTTADRKVTVATEQDMFTATIDQLTEGSTYFIRAYAINKNGVSYGETATFTTIGIVLPTVIANAATDLTETSATLNGAVTDKGNGTITSQGFCWSTSNNQPTIEDNKMETTGNGDAFTSAITGLTRNTKYYFRAYAINEKGIAYSEVKEFTTRYIVNPAVLSAVTVTNIAQTTLTATATLTDDGRGIISEMGFCYVAGTGTPTVNDTKLTVPVGGAILTRDFSSLTPGTTYTIRAYAVNENGTAYSEPVTITTKKNNPSEDDAEFPGVN